MNRWKIAAMVVGLMGSGSVAWGLEPSPEPGSPGQVKVRLPRRELDSLDARSGGCIPPPPADEVESQDVTPVTTPETVIFGGKEYRLDELPPRVRRLLEREAASEPTTEPLPRGYPRRIPDPDLYPPEAPQDPEQPLTPVEEPTSPAEPPVLERDDCPGCGMG